MRSEEGFIVLVWKLSLNVALSFFSGGVLTPGAAFAETTLIERLDKAGVRFVTVEEPKAITQE